MPTEAVLLPINCEEQDSEHDYEQERHRDLLQGWGKGPVVTFSHGWPLKTDAWDGQMHFLSLAGFRVIAYDRRGHGRSGQASSGNDYEWLRRMTWLP